MEIGYTAGAGGDCARAARATTRSCSIPTRWPSCTSRTASAKRHARIWKQMCADGWAGIGWPKEYGGQGRSAIEQFIFFDESMRAGAPVPMLTLNTVGPTIMEFGTDEQKAVLPAEDPRRRHPLLHRLLRARRGHRPRVAEDPGRARRRRVRHQRPEDVDVARRRRRLLLARGAHRPRGRRSTRASRSSSCPMDTPGITLSPLNLLGDHDINAVFFDDVRVPAANVRRRREQRLEADHQPAQPRAGHAVLERRGRPCAHRGRAGGRRRPSSPTAAA